MCRKQLTSKKEYEVLLKEIQRQLERSNPSNEFRVRYQQLKPHLDELETLIVKQNQLAIEKDHEWMKWLIVIAAGVFSVIVTQVPKMSSLSLEQLLLLKIAISTNALGIAFGAIYLYTDIMDTKDLGYKLLVQKYSLLLKGEKRYKDNVIYSQELRFIKMTKYLSLLCFLAVIIIWVCFVWQMQTDISPILDTP